ncbi:hypothetical protein AMTR_s00014p00242100 [Amborella trichopoda]|uniref:Uncharacterized protein n=1 Tax=Amborella trichopoda TaxID=13333 RepID=W1PMC7_AMBTC|nr:hypothetical protein AMTR_s00014p00242100 [Amborella trichopoda]
MIKTLIRFLSTKPNEIVHDLRDYFNEVWPCNMIRPLPDQEEGPSRENIALGFDDVSSLSSHDRPPPIKTPPKKTNKVKKNRQVVPNPQVTRNVAKARKASLTTVDTLALHLGL